MKTYHITCEAINTFEKETFIDVNNTGGKY